MVEFCWQTLVFKLIVFQSLFTENVLAHPCVVLRRQCQVNHFCYLGFFCVSHSTEV